MLHLSFQSQRYSFSLTSYSVTYVETRLRCGSSIRIRIEGPRPTSTRGVRQRRPSAGEPGEGGRQMIKSELIAKIAEENPHLYQREVETVVNAILDTITVALA